MFVQLQNGRYSMGISSGRRTRKRQTFIDQRSISHTNPSSAVYRHWIDRHSLCRSLDWQWPSWLTEKNISCRLSTIDLSSTYRKPRMEYPKRHVEYVPRSSSTSFDPEWEQNLLRLQLVWTDRFYLIDPRLPDLLAMHQDHPIIETHDVSRSAASQKWLI